MYGGQDRCPRSVAGDHGQGHQGARHRQELLASASSRATPPKTETRPGARRCTTAWSAALEDGRAGQGHASTPRSSRRRWRPSRNRRHGGIEVGFYPSSAAWDGRFANNGWMQEAPDPITKLVWGNAAMISPADGARSEIDRRRHGHAFARQLKMEAAVMIQPGHADDAVSIALGYGRAEVRARRQGCRLQRQPDPHQRRILVRAGLRHRRDRQDARRCDHAGARHRRATRNGRPLAREGAVDEYKKNPKVDRGDVGGSRAPLDLSGSELRQGLSVGHGDRSDLLHRLQRLRGRLQAENNIPVVGKDRCCAAARCTGSASTATTRATRTIREVVEQPIPCMQCENAPCENVCPVHATTHSPEGLERHGVQPLRRHALLRQQLSVQGAALQLPQLPQARTGSAQAWSTTPTSRVRMRGVMEKCTYCVQRIEEAKIRPRWTGGARFKDGEIKTACQQTCPADAIVFGDINDPNSGVAKLKKQERNYAMLAELGHQARARRTWRKCAIPIRS